MKLTELYDNIITGTIVDISNGGTFLWVYHPSAGFHIKKGSYAEHEKLFGDDVLYNSKYDDIGYDEFDRGYMQVYPALKEIYFMPTMPHNYYTHTHDVEEIFKNSFPDWKVVDLHYYHSDFEPNMEVKSIIKNSITELISSMRYENDDKPEYQNIYLKAFKSNLTRNLAHHTPFTVTIKGNITTVITPTERYKIHMPIVLNSDVYRDDFTIIPITAVKKTAKDTIREAVTQKLRGTYCWIYHPKVGLQVKKGNYADHSRLFNDILNDTPRVKYDDFDRGYIKVDPKHKTIYLMPTDAREKYTFPVKKQFKEKFPDWNVVVFEKQKIDFKPGAKLIAPIKKGIREFLFANIFRNDAEYGTLSKNATRIKREIEGCLQSGYISYTISVTRKGIVVKNATERYLITMPSIINSKTKFKDFTIIPMNVKG